MSSSGFFSERTLFANHLVMRGHGLKVVQQLQAHSTMEMTLHCAHLAPDLIDDAVQPLDGQSPAWSRKAPVGHSTATRRDTAMAPRETQGANILN